ncbi:precorrin-3B synthase [Gordonia sp. HY442]|uniref:precorrin-3B synthase n=1 Tax=Gordonia zhenghanii TaxID=2911516 RepID=UPI001F031208|nr:precorrin-3B synthase [Gordonia zhenghanii]MCF8604860.1 precorrin-3B synthase [Gordonia zhenghanii]
MSTSATGPAPDRCPGVFATHEAADGRLARIRIPGGLIDAAALDALAAAADEFGDGTIEITVRGNLQIRGIETDRVDEFGAAVRAAGLASDADHDRVRNVAMSPFTGRVGGLTDLRPVADDLHARLVTATWSTALSGRFWFGLDDGRGDVLARAADVTGAAIDADASVVVVGGVRVGDRVAHTDLAAAMIDAASVFAEIADGVWRVADLDDRRRGELYERLGPRDEASPAAQVADSRVGWFTQADGQVMLGAVVPFARLTAQQARFAAAIGSPVTVTPEREILIGDLDEAVADTVVRVFAPLGFVFDARSPWTTLTACTGAPGCGKSLTDVRGDLGLHIVGLDPDAGPPHPEHWVGCDRGCGSPTRSHVRVLASSDGYIRTARHG